MPPVIVNALTVDVEDYFQVSAFERVVSRDRLPEYESRVAANMDRLLHPLEVDPDQPRLAGSAVSGITETLTRLNPACAVCSPTSVSVLSRGRLCDAVPAENAPR